MENKQHVPALASERGTTLFLICAEGRGVSRGLARGVASVVCPLLRWRSMQGACAVPCFCSLSPVLKSGSRKKVVVGVFGFSVSLGLECAPNVHASIFSPIQFLCVLLLEDRCVQVQALQQRVPGPSLSQREGRSQGVAGGEGAYLQTGRGGSAKDESFCLGSQLN